MLERMQGARIEDQRCAMPRNQVRVNSSTNHQR